MLGLIHSKPYSDVDYILKLNSSEKGIEYKKKSMLKVYCRGLIYIVISYIVAFLFVYFFTRLNLKLCIDGFIAIGMLLSIAGLILLFIIFNKDYFQHGHKILVISFLIIEALLFGVFLLVVNTSCIQLLQGFGVSILIYLLFMLFIYIYNDLLIQKGFWKSVGNICLFLMFLLFILLSIFIVIKIYKPKYIKVLNISLLKTFSIIIFIFIVIACIKIHFMCDSFKNDSSINMDLTIDRAAIMFVSLVFDLLRIIIQLVLEAKSK